MELNALTRWESIGKDLYQRGDIGHEISLLKRRSKHIDRQRTERQLQRSEVEETIEPTDASPSSAGSAASSRRSSRQELDELEREEEAILSKWRQLREKGKVLRQEEEKLEQSVFSSALITVPDTFPPGHQRWVYFIYRSGRRFFKGFAFGYFGKFAFAFLGLCLRHKFNLPRLLPDLLKLLIKPELYRYGCFLGSFLMFFESMMRLLRMKNYLSRNLIQRHHRSVRVIVSACVASTLSITFLPKNVRLGISMFFVVRALEVLVRWGVEEQEKAYITHHHRGEDSASSQQLNPNLIGGMNGASQQPQSQLPTTNGHANTTNSAPSSMNGTSLENTMKQTHAAAVDSLSSHTAATMNGKIIAQTTNTNDGLSITLTDASPTSSHTSVVSSPTDTNGSLTTTSIHPDDSLLSTFAYIRSRVKRSLVRISKLPVSYHFDTLVMSLASAQVIWAWLFNRDTMDPGYLHFLDVQGGKVPSVQKGFIALNTGDHSIPQAVLGQINAMRSSEGRGDLDLSLPLPTLICNVLHRDHESCVAAVFDYWKASYYRALPVYLPVYLLPMVIFKHRQLLKHPLQILVPTFLNLARSTMFLSSYCTLAWGVACFFTHQFGIVTPVKGALAGLFAGLTVSIEKKGRRIELALYVLSQALPSLYRTLVSKRLLPVIPNGESMCFVAAMAVIMWSYVTRPHLLRSSYLSLFKFFFGSGGRSAGFSSRAVEHSTPKTLLQHSMREMGPPILSPDVEVERSESGLREDRNVAAGAIPSSVSSNTVASSSSSSNPTLLRPSAYSQPLGFAASRHVHRLSTVPDVDGSELDDSQADESDSTPPMSVREEDEDESEQEQASVTPPPISEHQPTSAAAHTTVTAKPKILRPRDPNRM